MHLPTGNAVAVSSHIHDAESLVDTARRAALVPLRVGIMLDNLAPPAWVERIVREIKTLPFLALSAVIVDGSVEQRPATWRDWLKRQRKAAPYRLWEWYEAADYRRFRHEGPDPFESRDITPLLGDAAVFRVQPQRTQFVDRFRAEDVQRIREARLDVLLRFGFRIVKGEILGAATYGIWSMHHGDNRAYRGGPALFWEIYERNPESGIVLQVLTETLDGGHVLYRSIGGTQFASLYKNRRETYFKGAEVMLRRLADLHREGWSFLESLDTFNEATTYTRGIYRRPTNGQMLRFLARTYPYRLQQKVLGALQEQWVLAWRRRGAERDAYRIVNPPQDRFYADPFLAEQDGRTFVFFEDCPQREGGKGTIAVAELGPHGLGTAQTVLDGPDHLSYPSLFRWRGEWFMLPETGQRRRVEIWRAVRFPGEWTFESVALEGVDARDATLCEYDGRWWMFVTLCAEGGPRADEVSLFYADTPFGPWHPHRHNPVVSDASHARSAGAIYQQGTALIRPSQDGRGGYGYAVTLSRIDRLTPREFHETPIGSIGPTWHPLVRGTHTIALSSQFEVIDGRMLRFRRRV